jgi:hypothetical protein
VFWRRWTSLLASQCRGNSTQLNECERQHQFERRTVRCQRPTRHGRNPARRSCRFVYDVDDAARPRSLTLSLTVLVDVFVNKACVGYASMAAAHVNPP